jgi:hypothetical protein
MIWAGAGLGAQENEENGNTEGSSDQEAVTDADVVAVLEDINQKLERIAPAMRDRERKGQFGGGPYFTTRFFLDMPTLNDYSTDLGDYGEFSRVAAPFVNGGGGTWRFGTKGAWQWGLDYWGLGFSEKGFRNHQEGAEEPNVTIDENDDGLDDFYSYAGWGLSVFGPLVQYKNSFAEMFFFTAGGKAGFGSEGFSISQNQRTVLRDFAESFGLAAQATEYSWERPLFMTGAYVGLQWKPKGEEGIFGMALNAGFDYFVPMSDWQPAVGVHRTDEAPPEDYNPMSAYVMVGPTFNY